MTQPKPSIVLLIIDWTIRISICLALTYIYFQYLHAKVENTALVKENTELKIALDRSVNLLEKLNKNPNCY